MPLEAKLDLYYIPEEEMAEEKFIEIVEREWTVGEWGWYGVRCRCAGVLVQCIRHESDIPDIWPDSVREAVRKRVFANRPLADNEIRALGRIETVEFRWNDGVAEMRAAGDWFKRCEWYGDRINELFDKFVQ